MSRDDGSTSEDAANGRGLLRIDAGALRDHGDRERIDRVWDRVEPKLTLGRNRSRLGKTPWVAMAVAASFALGVGASSLLRQDDDRTDPVVMGPAGVERAADIFAAGTTPRSYALPGGGTITLEPGSIVDTISRQGDALTLRLVRGNATFTTASVGSIDLVVDDAHLTAAAGARMQVRRDGDHALVEMLAGSAEVTAPGAGDELVASRLGPNDVRRVRVRVTTASLPMEERRRRIAPPALHDDEATTPLSEDAPLATPAWVIACKDGDDALTVELLQQDPGAAAAISDPQVLACVARGHQFLGHDADAISSYEKLMNQPNKVRAMQAADKLQRIYEKRRDGATTPEARAEFASKAEFFSQHKRQLSLAAVAQGQDLEVFERAEALCNRIQAEAGVNNWKAVASLSAQYKSAYPHGPCTATIRQILTQQPAATDGSAEPGRGADEDSPYDDDAK